MKFAIPALAVLALLSGCNKVSFNPGTPIANDVIDSGIDVPQAVTPPVDTPLYPVMPPMAPVTPVTPPSPPPVVVVPPPAVVVPPPVVNPPQQKAGTCTDQQNINGCLKCEINLPPPQPVSSKAQKLARIMSMACPIYNKSYPKDYVAPSTQQVWQHILACNPNIYPETTLTGDALTTMDRLLNEKDDSLRQKMFKALWWKPPYSNHFELYFGLANSEAAYVFCMDQEISGPLLTEEYWQAQAKDYWSWLNDPEAQARWRAAQLQRRQLLSCLNKPATQPLPVLPTCEYKSYEGDFVQGGRDFIATMLSFGYKVAIETSNSCNSVSTVPAANDPKYQGRIKAAGYRCF